MRDCHDYTVSAYTETEDLLFEKLSLGESNYYNVCTPAIIASSISDVQRR